MFAQSSTKSYLILGVFSFPSHGAATCKKFIWIPLKFVLIRAEKQAAWLYAKIMKYFISKCNEFIAFNYFAVFCELMLNVSTWRDVILWLDAVIWCYYMIFYYIFIDCSLHNAVQSCKMGRSDDWYFSEDTNSVVLKNPSSIFPQKFFKQQNSSNRLCLFVISLLCFTVYVICTSYLFDSLLSRYW